jgi:hypothetical protein
VAQLLKSSGDDDFREMGIALLGSTDTTVVVSGGECHAQAQLGRSQTGEQ